MNWRNLILVLANIPFALVGGVLAVFAGGGQLSLGAMIGFVTLFGITVRNSTMLLSHYEHLVEVEGKQWGYRTAAQGGVGRADTDPEDRTRHRLGIVAFGHR